MPAFGVVLLLFFAVGFVRDQNSALFRHPRPDDPCLFLHSRGHLCGHQPTKFNQIKSQDPIPFNQSASGMLEQEPTPEYLKASGT